MNVIGITENGSDFCHAVVKQQTQLDPQFAAAVKKLQGWEKLGDDELLDAQTFVSWYQKDRPNASIEDALNNESFAWQGLPLLGYMDQLLEQANPEQFRV